MSATERAGHARGGRTSATGPCNWEEVNQLLACLGEIDRQVRALQDQLQQKVAVLKQQWLEASLPLEGERKRLRDQMERFYWAHRDEVLAAGRKSAELAFGSLGSRCSRGVVIEDAGAALNWLAANGLRQYLRTRTEIDREDEGLSWQEKREKTRRLLEHDPLWRRLKQRVVGPVTPGSPEAKGERGAV